MPIPNNHQKSFVITNNNSSSFDFEGLGSNPTLTLFRGETYKFNVDAIETFGGIEYPFWIRTEQLEGITEKYDYNIGMVNNGDSRGTITFTVPYNAPNRLYYVSQNRSLMGGKIEIVNSSTTPFDLIKNEHFKPAILEGIKKQEAEINAIVSNKEKATFNNTVLAMENSGKLLSKVSTVFYNLNSANTNEEIQAIAKELAPKLSAHNDNIYLNDALFKRVKTVWDNQKNFNLNKEQAKILENLLTTSLSFSIA